MHEIAAITGHASLSEKKRLAFVSDEKRLNSQHPLSNFACSLTILKKNIAKSKRDLKGGGPGRTRTWSAGKPNK